MFLQIIEASETANVMFKKRMYDPQMNVPGVAEIYLTLNTLRWPLDFLKFYASRTDKQQQTYHA